MEYKTTYTQEEVNELTQWFEDHVYEGEVDLGHGLFISNVKSTIAPILHIAQKKRENRTFSGQIALAFRIKEELIRQGKV